MGADAIVMMVVAMLVLWGGLALAVVNLSRDEPSTFEGEPHRDL